MSFGVGCSHYLDPALLWLWCRAAAAALIRPLTWEPPDATGAALKRQKTERKKEKKERKKERKRKKDRNLCKELMADTA